MSNDPLPPGGTEAGGTPTAGVNPYQSPSFQAPSGPSPGDRPSTSTWLKTSGLILGLAFLASLCSIPFELAFLEQMEMPIPEGMGREGFYALIFVIEIALFMVIFAIATAIGIFLGTRVGLGAPDIAALLVEPREFRKRVVGSLGWSVGGGLVVGGIITGLAVGLESAMPVQNMTIVHPGPVPSLFGSLGAGIREEILCRLGLMGLFAWVATVVSGRSTAGAIQLAIGNVLATLIFGAIHLPQAAQFVGELTVPLVSFVLLLNGLAGVYFGWLYGRFGLVPAMIAHFSADIILHVVAPALA